MSEIKTKPEEKAVVRNDVLMRAAGEITAAWVLAKSQKFDAASLVKPEEAAAYCRAVFAWLIRQSGQHNV